MTFSAWRRLKSSREFLPLSSVSCYQDAWWRRARLRRADRGGLDEDTDVQQEVVVEDPEEQHDRCWILVTGAVLA